MSLNRRSRQGQFKGGRLVGLLLFSDRLCSEQKSVRSKTESLQYPSDLDRLGVKSVWAIWLSALQNIWSHKICHWFTAISGFFSDTLYVAEITHPHPKTVRLSEILQVERLSRRWCTKGKQRWYQETEKSEFGPNASESHTTSQVWYAAGSMPLPGERGRGRRGRDGGGQSTARTCCSVALIRVWVAIHPRRTARKVRSLWVWVGSHPRRTETLLFIYRYVYKHRETKFNEHMVYCFADKVMKFGECGAQTARVTGQKACVWVVLHPRRTGKVLTPACTIHEDWMRLPQWFGLKSCNIHKKSHPQWWTPEKELGTQKKKKNGAYKHGRHEKIWLKSLCAITNIKVFAMQDGRTDIWQASRTSTTHYIEKKKTKNFTSNISDTICKDLYIGLWHKVIWKSIIYISVLGNSCLERDS